MRESAASIVLLPDDLGKEAYVRIGMNGSVEEGKGEVAR
jgi:hypothetical protein